MQLYISGVEIIHTTYTGYRDWLYQDNLVHVMKFWRHHDHYKHYNTSRRAQYLIFTKQINSFHEVVSNNIVLVCEKVKGKY